jgi:hypothetical protein
MHSVSQLSYSGIALGNMGDLNLDGLTVTHMRDVAAMGAAGDGPMAAWPTTCSSCSTSCCTITD